MLIRSKKTNLENEVSKEDWQKILDRGDGSRYIVVKQDTKQAPAPKEIASADYSSILKQANKALREEKHEEAEKLFESALAIKPTPFIREKLESIKEFFEK